MRNHPSDTKAYPARSKRKGLSCIIATAMLVVSWLAQPAISQPITPEQSAQKTIEQLREEHGLASVVAAISKNGQLIWQGAAGFADVEARTEAVPETPYRIASITKSMTATAAMQLVEKGSLDLDDTVHEHLSDFPEKQWPFTLQQLLNHTSGIRHYQGLENRPKKHYPTLADALEVFQDSPLLFEPGSKYGYTTYGYTLIGRLIEVASGSSYEDYMKHNIWEPAHMSATGLEWKGKPIEGQAALYRIQREKLVRDMQTDLSVKFPGGGVVSTAGDLIRFANAFFYGNLVTAETRERMLVPPEPHNGPPYALGFMVFDSKELGTVIGNDGNQSGTNSNLIFLPEHGIAAAVITNVSNQGRVIQPFTRELAAIFVDK